MDLADYAQCDAVGLAALVRAGELSADEVEDAARRAIAKVDRTLHATVGGLLEPALESARDGPLGGVPFALKEVAPHLKGQVSQLGSRCTADGITGAADTYLGQRIRAAGLRVIARTRSPEFAFNATTEPLVHGPTCSPWDLERSVGGSSGGAAALVAARALPMAHGTDGGGSIRIPASLCGIVGLKPTRLRIPVGPALWEGLHGMAHDFILCRTLRDTAAALDALHGPAPGEKYVIPPPERHYAEEVGADPGRLRIAWTADAWSGAAVAPECRGAVEATAQALDGLGHVVEPGTPAIDPEVLHRALLISWAAGLAQRAALIERAVRRAPTDAALEACTLEMIRLGESVTSVQLLDGYGDCNAVGRSIGTFFETVDVLLCPSVARLPWKLGELDQDDSTLDAGGWVNKLFSRYVPFTAMFNITGQPAISLPLAWSESGLPIGVQLVGRYGEEATLLRVASQLEQAFPWAERVPPTAVGAPATSATSR
jgi:amidase